MREKQSIFILNFAKLIIWAFENGFEVTAGELFRTQDQQMLYFEGYTLIKAGSNVRLAKVSPKSKTMFSKHREKLAGDLNLFINGEYQVNTSAYTPLGEYWKSLHPENVWGGDWGWDANHFQMGK